MVAVREIPQRAQVCSASGTEVIYFSPAAIKLVHSYIVIEDT